MQPVVVEALALMVERACGICMGSLGVEMLLVSAGTALPLQWVCRSVEMVFQREEKAPGG
jgi:hypothetical protein